MRRASSSATIQPTLWRSRPGFPSPTTSRSSVEAESPRRNSRTTLRGLGETQTVPSERAARPQAASSVAPVASRYERSLRPRLGTGFAPRRRAASRQGLLAFGRSLLAGGLRLRLGRRLGGALRCLLALRHLALGQLLALCELL